MSILFPAIGTIRSRLGSKLLTNPSERIFRSKLAHPHGHSYSNTRPQDIPILLGDELNTDNPDRLSKNVMSNVWSIAQAPRRVFGDDENVSSPSSLENQHDGHQDFTERMQILDSNHNVSDVDGSTEISFAEKDSIAQAITTVSDTLRRGDADGLRSALSRASKDLDYIRSIPTTTYNEIRRLLGPNIFIKADDSTEISLAEKDSIAQAITTVSDTLRRGDADGLISALSQASKNPEYIRSIPTTTYYEICRLLDPSIFIEPYAQIYQDIHPHVEAAMKDQTLPMKEVFTNYSEIYQKIIENRTAHRRDLSFEELKLHLNVARCLRDGKMASKIWRNLVKSGKDPDTICYNHYFEAMCWSNTHNYIETSELWVESWSLISCFKTSKWGYRLANQTNWGSPRGNQTEKYRLKARITYNFSKMVETGVTPDGKTFSLLMTAHSREGDIRGVKSILKKVWDVDVDDIMASDFDSFKLANIQPESPLYPTDDLLFVVAHIFGSNKDLTSALRIVDHLSRKYDIKVGRKTWDELLHWAFVLSVPETFRPKRRPDLRSGQLPLASVTRLWETMVAPPYNCKPSMRMYGFYMKNAMFRRHLDLVLSAMLEGLSIHRSSMRHYLSLKLQRDANINNGTTPPPVDPFISLPRLRQVEKQARLLEFRNFIMISHWFYWLLDAVRWYGGTKEVLVWERLKLPLAVELFWDFRPSGSVIYSIATGRVELACHDTGNEENIHLEDIRNQNHTILRHLLERISYKRPLKVSKNLFRWVSSSNKAAAYLRPIKARSFGWSKLGEAALLSRYKPNPGQDNKRKISQTENTE